MFFAKCEVFDWLVSGKKTIDVRKGRPRAGHKAVFVSGPRRLTLRVVGVQVGSLVEVLREDNFRLVIPSADCLDEALAYFRGLYGVCDGAFTAYFVAP